MNRIISLLLVFLMLCGGTVANAEGIFPTLSEIYGEYMPSATFATGKKETEINTDNGILLEYSDFSYSDYETFGIYLNQEGCTLTDSSVSEQTVFARVTRNNSSIELTYYAAENKLTVFYPTGTRVEKEKYAITGSSAAAGINILPYYESVFGYSAPTISAAIHRPADKVERQAAGGIVYSYDQFTEEEYNAFSSYLNEKECSVNGYSMDGNMMTVQLDRKGSSFSFVYDRDNSVAKMIYPKGTFIEDKENCGISGHAWMKATCTEPKTCARCGQTEGEANGHQYGNWTVSKKASSTAEGKKVAKCTVCGDTISETIPKSKGYFSGTPKDLIKKINNYSIAKTGSTAVEARIDKDDQCYFYCNGIDYNCKLMFDDSQDGTSSTGSCIDLKKYDSVFINLVDYDVNYNQNLFDAVFLFGGVTASCIDADFNLDAFIGSVSTDYYGYPRVDYTQDGIKYSIYFTQNEYLSAYRFAISM